MDMDKAPLNRAHQLERKAETLSRQKKMDECIQCHVEAVELYKKCLQLGDNKQALESIQLQKEWNERQIRLLQLKKSYLERTKEETKYRGITLSKNSTKETVDNLEAKIFRNFETHDSLIGYLAQRGIIAQDRHYQGTIEEAEEKDESPFVVGNKHPKDDSIVIEELKELSGQLRESVQGMLNQLDDRQIKLEQIIEKVKNSKLDKSSEEELLIQLDDRNKEIGQLRAYIKDLELEKCDKEEISNNNLKTTTESSETSSSATEFDLDNTELNSLPQLEVNPISVPGIDISAFKQFRLPEVNRKLLGKSE
ncbi:unnamed protein product [Ceutorhynchus assimilis]|uniref:Nuclear receptor-binding factor 2 MIT domain-containing protein n=1 Tax=Ceutorhynchus assimilis TaxID=467358 RepID=A0A9P0E002_9CUCU|nr:unnamed protein product [Ceutorhynchus assimilis]